MHPARRSLVRGFTLVELIMTIVLIGLMAALGSTVIADAFTTARTVDANQQSADEARNALERVARELREVKFDEGTTAYAITSTMSAGATTLAFTRNIGGADVVVTLAKAGSTATLTYSSPAATSVLATGVATFQFDFLQLDNSATTSAANVKFIVVTLAITDPVSGHSTSQRTRVALRNA